MWRIRTKEELIEVLRDEGVDSRAISDGEDIIYVNGIPLKYLELLFGKALIDLNIEAYSGNISGDWNARTLFDCGGWIDINIPNYGCWTFAHYMFIWSSVILCTIKSHQGIKAGDAVMVKEGCVELIELIGRDEIYNYYAVLSNGNNVLIKDAKIIKKSVLNKISL